MSEGHGSGVPKGILNPSAGRFKPKANHVPRSRPSRSLSIPDRTPSPSPPPGTSTAAPSGSLITPPVVSVTAPTPQSSPVAQRRPVHKSTPIYPNPALRPPAELAPIQKSLSSGSGSKRKADEVDADTTTPPREHRTTFAPEPRTHRASATSSSSHAPSSFHRNKRARTSLESQQTFVKSGSPSVSGESPNAKSASSSWSSKQSKTSTNVIRPSRAPSSKEVGSSTGHHGPRHSISRRSISAASIPISAFMSPHAPSVSRSSTFHMRDPRKPARIQSTPWSLSFPDEVVQSDGSIGGRWALKGWTDRGGSPLHAWLFFIGFVAFPLWWLAGFLVPIPRTRRLEGGDAEKGGVALDDPQVEHDYISWRKRCRVMAIISLFTYVPFIICVAIFA